MLEENGNNVWPLPKFYFTVKLDSQYNTASFQEVSGLETVNQQIEYRYDNSPKFSTIKMPGIAKLGNAMLKKAVFVKDDSFIEWYGAIKMNVIKRETVTIQLLDEQGSPTMTSTLQNAWPTKISSADIKSDANEVAVKTLEFAYEALTVSNGS